LLDWALGEVRERAERFITQGTVARPNVWGVSAGGSSDDIQGSLLDLAARAIAWAAIQADDRAIVSDGLAHPQN
jgi:hypothetical protein